jgi:hypothetical protein
MVAWLVALVIAAFAALYAAVRVEENRCVADRKKVARLSRSTGE